MQQESKLISATELQLHVPVCRVLARTHRSAARCALVTSSHVFTWPGNKTMIQQYQQRKCTINLQHFLDRLRGIQRECTCNVLCPFISQMVMSQPGINHNMPCLILQLNVIVHYLLDHFKCFRHCKKVSQLWKGFVSDLTTKHSTCVRMSIWECGDKMYLQLHAIYIHFLVFFPYS